MTASTQRADDAGPPRLGWTGAVLPAAIIGAIFVLIVPLPAAVLDLLLAANITLAVLILLTTLAIRTPQEFAAFPTLLLTTTLTRLVLNVATTRRILSHGGEQGLDAAGEVVRAFGEFVAGDRVLVGVILFLILVVIQFVVITRGSTRIGEVAARFVLDGLPGRQMAIDADLHAGSIDQAEASRRREAVYRQADFFGAMDGAGKFVRGDAVAGIVITTLNVLAGLYLGVVVYGMPAAEAVDVFTKLTIGDGLVTQVPAFLIALASGLIVTRSSTDSDLGREVVGQLLGRPEVLGASAVFLSLLAFTGLPKLPLLSLAAALGVSAAMARSRRDGGRRVEMDDEGSRPETSLTGTTSATPLASSVTAAPALAAIEIGDRMEELLHVDPLELEVGFRLIALTDSSRGGDMLDRIRAVRQRVARDLGLIVPQVRIRDEMGLGPHEYRLKIRGAVVGQGTAYAGRLLAIPPAGLGTGRPDGRDGIDPVSGLPAVWIHADGREVAELSGCRIVEASAVVAGHLGEIVLGHADELMTHEQAGRLLDRAKITTPALVEEVVPGMLRAGEFQRVLQGLLRERVSVLDMETILEALAEHAGKTRDTDVLTEQVRRALGRRIAHQYRGADGRLRAVVLSRALDSRLAALGISNETRPGAAPGADAMRALVRAVASAVGPLVEAGHPPVVLASAEARPVLKDLTRADLPRLVVLSHREIPRDTPVETLGTVVEEESPLLTSMSTSTEGLALAGFR